MKATFFACALLLGLVLVCSAASTNTVKQQFIEFQSRFNKLYSTKDEFDARFAIFEANLKNIDLLNAKNGNKNFGITKFMDMSPEEFKQTILMTKLPAPINPKDGPYHNETFDNVAIPSTFDWRNTPGVVTPVYNQGQCGSCWAFSATENIESQWARAGNTLTSLSMQQIVSCDTTDYGCNGGWPYNAYAYVASAGGLDSYSSYPYTAENTPCSFSSSAIAAKLQSNSWAYVTQNQDESEMQNFMVAHGPLSVCVDASSWQYYSSGVFSSADCGTSIDHCVEAIGYNTAANPPYWIVRNSWGTDWGVAGYIYVQYGVDACAIAQVVTNSNAQ